MKPVRLLVCWMVTVAFSLLAYAHDLPFSYVDLVLTNSAVDATVEGSAKNFAAALGGVEERTLLIDASLRGYQDALFTLVGSRLTLSSEEGALAPAGIDVRAIPDRGNLRVRLRFTAERRPSELTVKSHLFPNAARQKTFLNMYDRERLLHQGILSSSVAELHFSLGLPESIFSVVRQFVGEGVHHIFIGPDHILFIIGLLLLGGTLAELLKIVSAFTLAHSITLALATLDIFSPPARLVEPAIALSIIFVGAHALLRKEGQRDFRLWFAFGFGFIHGFGFASVLRELGLPQAALGWSLFSFNLGVEIGQAIIVFMAVPLLASVRRAGKNWAERVVLVSSLSVVSAGGYWFLERVFPGP